MRFLDSLLLVLTATATTRVLGGTPRTLKIRIVDALTPHGHPMSFENDVVDGWSDIRLIELDLFGKHTTTLYADPHDYDSHVYLGSNEQGDSIDLSHYGSFLHGHIFIMSHEAETFSVQTVDEQHFAVFHDYRNRKEEDRDHENLEAADEVRHLASQDSYSLRGSRDLASGPSIIDVLVVWTKLAECKHSKGTNSCTTDDATKDKMLALADQGIHQTNTAFTNSGINAQVNLIHAERLPATYTEGSAVDTLNHLRSTSDNNIDSVHDLRSQVGADIVMMLYFDSTSCGRGGYSYPNPNPANMFAVVSYDCLQWYSFAHELGHTMVRTAMFTAITTLHVLVC